MKFGSQYFGKYSIEKSRFKVLLFYTFTILLTDSSAQLTFVGADKSFAADTSRIATPASACWGRTSFFIQTNGIASVPKLTEAEARFDKRRRSCAWGIAVYRNGTEFLNTSQIHSFAGYRSSGISGGITAGIHQYYAKEYYSLYRFQMSLSTMARLLKGKWWFAMNMNNLVPDANKLIEENTTLQLSSSYSLISNFRTGIQHNWRSTRASELILWKELRWNKYIAHQFFYNTTIRHLTILIKISHKHHTWQGGGTLFYQPGFIWSCAYMYSF